MTTEAPTGKKNQATVKREAEKGQSGVGEEVIKPFVSEPFKGGGFVSEEFKKKGKS